MPIPENRVWITNVAPGECIPMMFTVQVDYANADLPNAKVAVSCGGSSAPPEQDAPTGTTGTLSFALNHGGTGSGHTIAASLKSNGASMTGASVSPVSIGNPCVIVIGVGEMVGGIRMIGTAAALSGTYKPGKGNEVILLVEDPAHFDDWAFRRAKLTFADPATTSVQKGDPTTGVWKHDPIKSAKPGQHLLVVLTKDGEVASIVRAIFK